MADADDDVAPTTASQDQLTDSSGATQSLATDSPPEAVPGHETPRSDGCADVASAAAEPGAAPTPTVPDAPTETPAAADEPEEALAPEPVAPAPTDSVSPATPGDIEHVTAPPSTEVPSDCPPPVATADINGEPSDALATTDINSEPSDALATTDVAVATSPKSPSSSLSVSTGGLVVAAASSGSWQACSSPRGPRQLSGSTSALVLSSRGSTGLLTESRAGDAPSSADGSGDSAASATAEPAAAPPDAPTSPLAKDRLESLIQKRSEPSALAERGILKKDDSKASRRRDKAAAKLNAMFDSEIATNKRTSTKKSSGSKQRSKDKEHRSNKDPKVTRPALPPLPLAASSEAMASSSDAVAVPAVAGGSSATRVLINDDAAPSGSSPPSVAPTSSSHRSASASPLASPSTSPSPARPSKLELPGSTEHSNHLAPASPGGGGAAVLSPRSAGRKVAPTKGARPKQARSDIHMAIRAPKGEGMQHALSLDGPLTLRQSSLASYLKAMSPRSPEEVLQALESVVDAASPVKVDDNPPPPPPPASGTLDSSAASNAASQTDMTSSIDGPHDSETPGASSMVDLSASAAHWTEDDYNQCVKLFNEKPKKGVALLIEKKIVQPTPESVSTFLFSCPDLDKTMIGDYLGDNDPFHVACLSALTQNFNWVNSDFDLCMRQLLYRFRLPGEAQKIDRIVAAFAGRYYAHNKHLGIFKSADACYVLAFATIMLNTDAHSAQVKKKMTVDQFLKNNRGINDGDDISAEFLKDLYNRIVNDEIKMKTDAGKFANAVKKGWLHYIESSNKKSKARMMWTVMCENELFLFKKMGEQEPAVKITVSFFRCETQKKDLRFSLVQASSSRNPTTHMFVAPNERELTLWLDKLQMFVAPSASNF